MLLLLRGDGLSVGRGSRRVRSQAAENEKACSFAVITQARVNLGGVDNAARLTHTNPALRSSCGSDAERSARSRSGRSTGPSFGRFRTPTTRAFSRIDVDRSRGATVTCQPMSDTFGEDQNTGRWTDSTCRRFSTCSARGRLRSLPGVVWRAIQPVPGSPAVK